jgi:purine-binding chemotaxis protein CheW
MNETSRYLCFHLGKEEFAIPLLTVREVLGMPEVTAVPQTPPHFLGIMNLRGKVISVMDLRTKLGIKPTASDETAVIILDLGTCSFGIVIDRVNSVQEITQNEAVEKPSLENSKANEYISGVFKKQDHLILILDISKALSIEDRQMVSRAA